MLAGLLYDCGDPELLDRWHTAKDLVRDYNRLDSRNLAEKDRILTRLLGGRGKNVWVTPPFLWTTATASTWGTTVRST